MNLSASQTDVADPASPMELPSEVDVLVVGLARSAR